MRAPNFIDKQKSLWHTVHAHRQHYLVLWLMVRGSKKKTKNNAAAVILSHQSEWGLFLKQLSASSILTKAELSFFREIPLLAPRGLCDTCQNTATWAEDTHLLEGAWHTISWRKHEYTRTLGVSSRLVVLKFCTTHSDRGMSVFKFLVSFLFWLFFFCHSVIYS